MSADLTPPKRSSPPGSKLALADDQMCYVCGKDNPAGLRLDFVHPGPGVLTATVTFSKQHQGFKGVVHGGMMAMVLDEMMVNLAWKEGHAAVTAELTVRLKKAARVGEAIRFEGRLLEAKKRVLRAEATARDAGGEVLATAQAVCLKV